MEAGVMQQTNRITSTLDLYTDEERDFLKAVDWYKRRFRSPHPTWEEIFALAHFLGYRKVEAQQNLPKPGR